MKALSIKQPWASLIAHGIKDIENRTWKTHFRGRIYIHASSNTKGFLALLNKQQVEDLRQKTDLEFEFTTSEIIGEVDIIDCVINHPSVWAERTTIHIENGKMYSNEKPTYNWVLANAKLYDKPIMNVKGKLSFWELDKTEIIKNTYGRFYNPQKHHYSVSGYTDPTHYSDEEMYDMLQEIDMEFGEFRCRPKVLSNIFK